MIERLLIIMAGLGPVFMIINNLSNEILKDDPVIWTYTCVVSVFIYCMIYIAIKEG